MASFRGIPPAHASIARTSDAFGTLIFKVTGQQLSVRSTRSILDRMVELSGGRVPSRLCGLVVGPPAPLSRRLQLALVLVPTDPFADRIVRYAILPTDGEVAH